jgi:hypothetical protein
MANEGGGDAATFDDERAEVTEETVEWRRRRTLAASADDAWAIRVSSAVRLNERLGR